MRKFLDTNVLLYADDLDSDDKRRIAQDVLRGAMSTGEGVISVQVLQEFYVVSTRKLGVDAATARRKVELLGQMDLVKVDLALILGAIDLSRLHSFSFWDALIVRAASIAGCSVLVSEDLQHGQVIEGVRVENPFIRDSEGA